MKTLENGFKKIGDFKRDFSNLTSYQKRDGGQQSNIGNSYGQKTGIGKGKGIQDGGRRNINPNPCKSGGPGYGKGGGRGGGRGRR